MSARPLEPEDRQFGLESTQERLARLEERVSVLKSDLTEIKATVWDIHAIILQGKGAKWAIIGIVSVISSFLGSYAHKLISLFNR